MLNHTQALEKHVVITNQLDTMTSFALDEETGEQVFISARLCKLFNLEVGDHLKAFVTPNKVPENKVPWYAIYVKRVDPPEHASKLHEAVSELEPQTLPVLVPEPEPEPETEKEKWHRIGHAKEVLDHLKGGMDSAKNIGLALGLDTTKMLGILSRLHNNGYVARASIKQCESQKRDSYVLWSLEAKDFLPED